MVMLPYTVGIKGAPVAWCNDMEKFNKWARGLTGIPFIDACMRELRGSGFMSNRGRQNVASFLTKELGEDWRLGKRKGRERLIFYVVVCCLVVRGVCVCVGTFVDPQAIYVIIFMMVKRVATSAT